MILNFEELKNGTYKTLASNNVCVCPSHRGQAEKLDKNVKSQTEISEMEEVQRVHLDALCEHE
jgi:hypothetical protein